MASGREVITNSFIPRVISREIYRNFTPTSGVSRPTTPAGGSYNTSNQTWASLPTGWSQVRTALSAGQTRFVSLAIITETPTSSTTSSILYSAVSEDLTTGANGADAPREVIRTVYLTAPQQNPPVNPTALSFNFLNGEILGLTSTWQAAPVDVTVTNTADRYWTATLRFSELSRNGTQVVEPLGSPVSSINIGDNLQSDNFISGSAGWRLERDTGNAEFSNVLIRGASSVAETSIGGDGLIQSTPLTPSEIRGETSTSYSSDFAQIEGVTTYMRLIVLRHQLYLVLMFQQ